MTTVETVGIDPTETKHYYNDLPNRIQEHIRNKYIESLDYEWWDCVYEDAKEKGYELGFDIGRINFSGFYSQGDGACWSGQIDIVQWLRSHTEDSIGLEAWVQLIREEFLYKHIPVGYSSNYYSHSGTMSCGYWDGVFHDDLEGDDALLRQDSIFQGMHYQDLLSIILHDNNMPYKNMSELAEAVEQSARDYADKIYDDLRKEWEYLCSEEVMLEHFDANGIMFNEDGEVMYEYD
jgi:hypothetical protein